MSDIEIKIEDFTNATEAVKKLAENAERYIKYLNETHLPNLIGKNIIFEVKEYDYKNLFAYEDQMYYTMYIHIEKLNTDSVHSILNGPIKNLYEMNGVVDARLHPSAVELIYFAPFFLQENLFASFEAIDKFKL
jgi:hypothetical protein